MKDELKTMYELITMIWQFLKKWIPAVKSDAVWMDMIHEANQIVKDAASSRPKPEAQFVREVMLSAMSYIEAKERE